MQKIIRQNWENKVNRHNIDNVETNKKKLIIELITRKIEKVEVRMQTDKKTDIG
jgi:hypothetical protein